MRDRSRSSSALQRVLVFTTLAILFSSLSVAAAEKRRFDIAAGEASSTLNEFSRQSELQIYFDADAVRRFMTNAVAGEFEAADALSKMLGGTGLAFEFVNERTVAIMLERQRAQRISSARPMIYAGLVDAPLPSAGSGESPNQPEQAQSDGSDQSTSSTEDDRFPEVLVRGSRVLNVDIRRSRDDAQPYVIFDRAAIETSGAVSLDDFFKQRLTMNTGGLSSNQQAATFGNMSQVNLRGLGSNQTLILVDGRRLAGVSGGGNPLQPDLNGIPLSAVERIEVLPTTASGIYGGSATGGVVNIVLRRDYAGTEIKVGYENSFDPDSAIRRLDLSQGFSFEGGKTTLVWFGSYSDQEALLVRNRTFVQRGRAAILANNPAFLLNAATPPLGATTNIRSVNGSPLFGPGTPNFTSVPVGYSGGGGLAPLSGNAGQYNLDLANSAQSIAGERGLLNEPTVEALNVTVRREFTPRLRAFVEASGSNNSSNFPVSGLDIGGGTTGAVVNGNAPNNPFGQAVRVTVPSSAGDGELEIRNSSRRVAGGVIYEIGQNWSLAADYTWTRASFENFQPRAASLAALIANGTIDVFRDTSANPLNVESFLREFKTSPLRSTTTDVSLRVAGAIGSLPGGNLVLSALAEHRKDRVGDGSGTELLNSGPGTPFTPTAVLLERQQSIDSLYLELRVPLVSPAQDWRGVHELELQMAGRSDRYETDSGPSRVTPGSTAPILHVNSKFSSTDPTFGLRFKPVQDLMIRSSYGTGFLPPGVSDFVSIGPFAFPAGILIDPRRGNTTTGAVSQIAGGNPNIRPEQSKSWSVGAVFTPRFAGGLRVSVDYTRIRKTDNITALSAQQLINNEGSFPLRVTRGPVPPGDPFGVGPITALDLTLINFARTRADAYDAAIEYRWNTSRWGTLDFLASGTWQPVYDTQALPNDPFTRSAGVSSSFPLKFKANGGLTWKQGRWMLGWFVRRFDSYLVADPRLASSVVTIANQGKVEVPSQQYHDLFASYRFASSSFSVLDDTEVHIGIKNILDKEPPFDASAGSTGLYSVFGDPRLASYSISLKKRF